MSDTLSDLLELSRIGRVVNPSEEFALSKLIQEALETVEGRIRSRNIRIKVSSPMPIIYGDRKRLHEVFENLIDNAAKYMGDQKSPLIEIGQRSGEEPVFFVKDNGMGIASPYHSKVFGLFEKLDAMSEGTGVGLALVKRIIELHGGKIWVESDGLGKGSTFCFTIPDNRKMQRVAE
jgi:signal transduction histidine kinase